jgi:DNA-binding NarL/FixJ family response regulator
LPGGGLPAALEVAPPTARVVVFADDTRGELVIEALQLGVSGYLLKSTPASSLGLMLQAVMRGEPVVDHSLVKTLVEAVTRQPPLRRTVTDNGDPGLTPREQQVAMLLGAGSSTREIADALGVSPVTARRHISSLMAKLEVASRDAARQLIGG